MKEVAIILDRATRQSKGFGFVEMTTADAAQKAIEKFHNYELNGRKITVNIARPREERPGGGGGFRGGDRGGRGGFGGRGDRGGRRDRGDRN